MSNRRFLGQFGVETVSLSLSNLPSHSLLTVSFDLFVIRSWDGNIVVNNPDLTVGPDVWGLRYDGGNTLLNATFGNWEDGSSPTGDIVRQSYPSPFPGNGNFASHTGAAEVNTLGFVYPDYNGGAVQDSVYHLAFTFPHTAPLLSLDFVRTGLTLLPVLSDESWGIDNVRIVGDSAVAPEPSTLALCGFGFLGAGLVARRRRWLV